MAALATAGETVCIVQRVGALKINPDGDASECFKMSGREIVRENMDNIELSFLSNRITENY